MGLRCNLIQFLRCLISAVDMDQGAAQQGDSSAQKQPQSMLDDMSGQVQKNVTAYVR